MIRRSQLFGLGVGVSERIIVQYNAMVTCHGYMHSNDSNDDDDREIKLMDEAHTN